MDYRPGLTVTFVDETATTSGNESVLVTGPINGDPITSETGEVISVPVWAKRDNGRELTTVLVAVENILNVSEPPPR